jgi:hypothetical protein
MPNPFLISILTLITTLATTPTIANTDLNTPNKTTTIVGYSGFVFNERVKLYFYDKRVAFYFFLVFLKKKGVTPLFSRYVKT